MPETNIPTCNYCGYSCKYGCEVRSARQDPETGYIDETVICEECLQGEQEEGYRDMAADAAMDMQEGY